MVGGGTALDAAHRLAQNRGKGTPITDESKPHSVLGQLVRFLLQNPSEQAEQLLHLVGGARPVLAAEGEQGQVLDARLGACADALAGGRSPRSMAFETREPATARPPAVSVHDDREVPEWPAPFAALRPRLRPGSAGGSLLGLPGCPRRGSGGRPFPSEGR